MGWAPSGSFRCSDDVSNWLHDAVQRTVVAYTTFLPNDPVREWKAWMQDPQNMFWSSAYLFDSQTMYERWQWDILDAQRPDGSCANVTPGAYYDAYNSPWWGGCAVWLPWHWYLCYGDDSLLADSYPAMKRYVDYLGRAAAKPDAFDGRITEEGLQDWGLADWCPVEETPRALRKKSPSRALRSRRSGGHPGAAGIQGSRVQALGPRDSGRSSPFEELREARLGVDAAWCRSGRGARPARRHGRPGTSRVGPGPPRRARSARTGPRGGPVRAAPRKLRVEACVANLDNVHVVPARCLGDLVGTLPSSREREVKRALGYALGWAELQVL